MLPGPAPSRHDVSRARGLRERLLRVAQASGIEAGARGWCPLAADPHDPRGVAADVWCAAGVPGAARRRRRGRSGSRGSIDARGGDSGSVAPALRHDDAARRCAATGAGSRRASLRGGRAESALGGRHHVHPDLGGLLVSGDRARRLESSRRRLGRSKRICAPGSCCKHCRWRPLSVGPRAL